MNNDFAENILRLINEFLTSYAPNFLSTSPCTLKSYEDAIRLYITFLGSQGISYGVLDWNCFDNDNISKWLLWLRDERGCSPETCNIRLSSIRTFLSFVQEKDVSLAYLHEASKAIHRLPTQKRKVNGLTKDAVNAILDVPDLNTKIGLRDFCFIMLTYSTACRIDEILSLKIKDIHLEGRKPYINIFGKGQKQRVAYLLPRIVSNLKTYISHFHGKAPQGESYLFFSPVGNGCERKLTEPAIDKRLKLYAKVAHEKCIDVPNNLHCHQFRHAKATHWIEDGIDVVKVSFLLGHANLETTMKYLDISEESKIEALATLETETDKQETKKWKDESLLNLLKQMTG